MTKWSRARATTKTDRQLRPTEYTNRERKEGARHSIKSLLSAAQQIPWDVFTSVHHLAQLLMKTPTKHLAKKLNKTEAVFITAPKLLRALNRSQLREESK